MLVIVFGNVILVSDVHPENNPSPKLLTLLGRAMLVNKEQLAKAFELIDSKEFGNEMLASDVQL